MKDDDSLVDSVEKAKLPIRTSFTELGRTGLNVQRGVIMDEELNELKGKKARIAFRQMAQNDATIAGVLNANEMVIRQVPWYTEPGGNNAAHQEDADFIWGCLNDMSASWEGTLAEILTNAIYGWSAFEEVYKRRRGPRRSPGESSRFNDGKIGWRSWSPRSQLALDHWEMDDTGAVLGMWQRAAPDFKLTGIPIEKLLIFRTTEYLSSPEGASLLRRVWRACYLKMKLENTEAVGVERDLVGIPIALIPAEWMGDDATSADSARYADTKQLVRNLRVDEQQGIVAPSDRDENGNLLMDVSLMESPGQRQFDVDKIIRRLRGEIASAFMADWLFLGQDGTGSYALSSDKTRLYAFFLGAQLDGIASVINRHAIPRLLRLNGRPLDVLPKLLHGDVETVNVKELSELILRMTAAGAPMFPDTKLEDFIRESVGLPKSELGEEEL